MENNDTAKTIAKDIIFYLEGCETSHRGMSNGEWPESVKHAHKVCAGILNDVTNNIKCIIAKHGVKIDE